MNKEETQYLNIIKGIIDNGYYKMDHTGTGTYTKLGVKIEFDLKERFPLLTTKKVFFRGIVEELLWFIKGDTNSKNLSKKGIKIWDRNSSREYLDKIGLKNRKVGDLGPIYGFQWRHFGAPYIDCETDYTGKGIDQLKNCIHLIKNNPSSRRILMSAWNPPQTKEMALPPCHLMCQFFVIKKEYLSCLVYLRSGDMGLGIPFNIASYALLTCMVAQVCGLKRGSLIQIIGDAHVYKNHIEPLKEQLKRVPREFPKLILNKVKDIDGFKYEDFKIVDYNPYPTIKMKMSV